MPAKTRCSQQAAPAGAAVPAATADGKEARLPPCGGTSGGSDGGRKQSEAVGSTGRRTMKKSTLVRSRDQRADSSQSSTQTLLQSTASRELVNEYWRTVVRAAPASQRKLPDHRLLVTLPYGPPALDSTAQTEKDVQFASQTVSERLLLDAFRNEGNTSGTSPDTLRQLKLFFGKQRFQEIRTDPQFFMALAQVAEREADKPAMRVFLLRSIELFHETAKTIAQKRKLPQAAKLQSTQSRGAHFSPGSSDRASESSPHNDQPLATLENSTSEKTFQRTFSSVITSKELTTLKDTLDDEQMATLAAVYQSFAALCCEDGDCGAGLQYVNASIALNPIAPDVFFLRATCLDNLRRRDEAYDEYRKAFSMAPPTVDQLLSYATCCANVGRTEEATKTYEEGIEMATSYVEELLSECASFADDRRARPESSSSTLQRARGASARKTLTNSRKGSCGNPLQGTIPSLLSLSPVNVPMGLPQVSAGATTATDALRASIFPGVLDRPASGTGANLQRPTSALTGTGNFSQGRHDGPSDWSETVSRGTTDRLTYTQLDPSAAQTLVSYQKKVAYAYFRLGLLAAGEEKKRDEGRWAAESASGISETLKSRPTTRSAQHFYECVLRADPSFHEPYANDAEIALNDGQYERAIELFAYLTCLFPASSIYYLRIAAIRRMQGPHHAQEEVDALSKALDRRQESVSHRMHALLRRSVLYTDHLGLLDEGIADLSMCLALSPGHPLVLLKRADAYSRRGREPGDHAAAVTDYTALVSCTPTDLTAALCESPHPLLAFPLAERLHAPLKRESYSYARRSQTLNASDTYEVRRSLPSASVLDIGTPPLPPNISPSAQMWVGDPWLVALNLLGEVGTAIIGTAESLAEQQRQRRSMETGCPVCAPSHSGRGVDIRSIVFAMMVEPHVFLALDAAKRKDHAKACSHFYQAILRGWRAACRQYSSLPPHTPHHPFVDIHGHMSLSMAHEFMSSFTSLKDCLGEEVPHNTEMGRTLDSISQTGAGVSPSLAAAQAAATAAASLLSDDEPGAVANTLKPAVSGGAGARSAPSGPAPAAGGGSAAGGGARGRKEADKPPLYVNPAAFTVLDEYYSHLRSLEPTMHNSLQYQFLDLWEPVHNEIAKYREEVLGQRQGKKTKQRK